MSKVLMYSTAVCPFCVRAEQLLTRKGVADIDKVRVDLEPERRAEMMERTGRRRGRRRIARESAPSPKPVSAFMMIAIFCSLSRP